jgi:hypothetical protein
MGQALALGWIRFFWGLVRSTISIVSSGSVTAMIVGLVLLTAVAAIAAIPLILGSVWWLVAGFAAMIANRNTAVEPDSAEPPQY